MSKSKRPARATMEALKVLSKESERGCMLVGGAMVDEHLADAIAAVCVSPDAGLSIVGEYQAPGGSFGHRIRLAYALGIVSNDEHASLSAMKSIRNAAAHFLDGSHEVSFRSEKIKSHVRRLITAKDYPPGPDAPDGEPERVAYEMFAAEMCLRLAARTTIAIRPKSPHEMTPNATKEMLSQVVAIREVAKNLGQDLETGDVARIAMAGIGRATGDDEPAG